MTTRSTYPDWLFDGSPIADPLNHGQRAVDFLRLLKHPKSKLPKRAFQLDPWQERIVRRIYGPRHEDGRRIVSTVVILVPRGNRKTSLAAALALLHTLGPERVPGGEAIFAASDRTQAGIAFKEACGIVRADPKHLIPKTKVYDAFNFAKKISYNVDGSELIVVSSDAPGQEGRTPAFVLADEIHVWRGTDLWKVLTNGLDKTDNSLLVIATTAGRGQESIAYEVIERARKVARGEIDDPSLLPVLFESEKDCDWTSEDQWLRVNPGSAYGYPSIEGFRRHVVRAKESPTERESLRQYKFNEWLDHSTDPFVDMATYDRGATLIDIDALAGQTCWLGVDMSTTTDLTAVVAAFCDGDRYVVVPHFFCPADNLRARGDRDGVPYVEWAKQGFITPTPGNVIDYSAVEACIRGLCERFDVREIGFDPAYAQAVMGPLTNDGLPVVTVRQGWVTQSPALNTLERAIVGGNFQHGGHPVLRWCFSNVAIHTDSAGNRTMHKGKSTDRIDGAVATWMAVSRAASNDSAYSFYNDPAVKAEDLVWHW